MLHCVSGTLQQATANSHLCQRFLGTHGQVQVSLFCGLQLLSPGSWCAESFVCALQETVSPTYVCPPTLTLTYTGASMEGLMVTSARKADAIPKPAAPRALPPRQATAELYLHRRHSHTVLAQSLWSLWDLVHARSV